MLRAAVIVASLAACHARKAPQHPEKEQLVAIKLEGNHAIGRDRLLRGLALHRHIGDGRDVDEYELATDTTRIAGAYQKLGYLGVDVHARVERTGTAATVVFTITEGPRAKVLVKIEGLPDDVPYDRARSLVHVADGAPFDYDVFDDSKQPLRELVENAGYAYARLEAAVDADRGSATATMRFAFDAGPRCTFAEPVVAPGIHPALANAVRARVAFHAGDRYSTAAIEATRSAIYGMSRFSTVHVDFAHDGDATSIVVKIEVTEGNRHEIRFGGGFAIDPLNYTLRFVVPQYIVSGWPTPLSTTSVDVRPGVVALRAHCGIDFWNCDYQFRGRILGALTRQDLLRPNLNGDLQGGLDYLVIEAYTISGGRLRLGLASPVVTKRVQVRVGYQFGVYYFSSLDSALDTATAAQLGVDRPERLGALSQVVVVDLRDRPIEPRYGAYAELRVTEGSRYLGGAYDYLQLTPELRLFAPPLGFVQAAARLRVGAISGDVPPTERYFGGGASSFRGFGERGMGPVATSATDGHTVVVGGAGLIETGIELRARVGKLGGSDFGAVAFLDGGDVTAQASALDPGNLYWAVGVGVRYFLLPIGPFRVDLGYLLNRTAVPRYDYHRLSVFLGVGEAF